MNETAQEAKKLAETVSLVKDSLANLEDSMEKLGAVNVQKLKEMRENPATSGADFLQFLQLLEEKNAQFNIIDKYKMVEELNYLSVEPYFSRIDLNEKPYYIGKFGFTDNKNPVVIDWRAKLASVYYKYRFPQKGVIYQTPAGPVTADLTLKRTFDIDKGELIKFYNNDLKLDETEIIADKISERTGGVLEDIVETIQQNQHEIIEADPRRICIVQGTVGSGKSTVAIHKLSYIFFNFADVIKPSRSILIAKNQILVGYLSTLFPKLGIFDINYGTIRDVVYNFLFREEIATKFDLSKNYETGDFTIEKLRELRDRFAQIHEEYKKAIEAVFASPENEPYGGFVYDKKVPVRQNITELIKDLEEEISYQKDYIKENSGSSRAEKFKENIKVMRKILKKLADLRVRIRAQTMVELVKEFSSDSRGNGYEEALVFALIFTELVGLTKYAKFQYCVIDEGQDFGVLEYAVLDKFVMNGRFSILGDLNQSYAQGGLASWEEISEVITGAKDAQKFVLDTNYRSTRPIIEFANRILEPYTSEYLPISINRVGPEPIISTNNDVETELAKDIEDLTKSIGIICMDDESLKRGEAILAKLNPPKEKVVRLRETDRIAYMPRAIYLTHFDNCKGLEFAKVYVLGLDLSKVRTFTEAKRAFVAVTRAMDELHIYA